MKYLLGFTVGVIVTVVAIYGLRILNNNSSKSQSETIVSTVNSWIDADKKNIKTSLAKMVQSHPDWQESEKKSDPSIIIDAFNVKNAIFVYQHHLGFYELQFRDGTKYIEKDKEILKMIHSWKRMRLQDQKEYRLAFNMGIFINTDYHCS